MDIVSTILNEQFFFIIETVTSISEKKKLWLL